jgi:hypothetical protein
MLSILFLAYRNIYEDELWSFKFIMKPFYAVIIEANATDIHPPGMYVISKIFYNLTRSERWMAIGPILILQFALISFFIATKACFNHDRVVYLIYINVFFHPQIVMWGNSIRWHPYWTALALITMKLGLAVRREVDHLIEPSFQKCIFIGLLLSIMFYISYMDIFIR